MGEHGVLIERKGGYLLVALRQPTTDASTGTPARFAVVTIAGECLRREPTLDAARDWLETLVREDVIACEFNTPAQTRAGSVR